MNRLGIKYQILLITFIPAFIIDAFFTYSHINTSITQGHEILQDKGRIITRQISGASEFYLFSGNIRQIQHILDQTIGTDDIVSAAVYNNIGELIAQSRTDDYEPKKSSEYFYHHQPITSQSIEVSDVFSPDQPDGEPQTSYVGWVHIYLSKERLKANNEKIIRNAMILFIAALVMTLILTTIISRGITTPIFKLVQHLRRVETGHLGELIESVEHNEIGSVQKGFNRMTQALVTNRNHLNDRIQQATQQLNQAIKNLETKNRELGFARDEAQNANRIKSVFLANMSHEIRTPINGIKGFINLMARADLSPSQRRYADIILKSTNDLTSIIEEILDFAKLESGKLQIVENNFDLHEIIEQTRDILFINVINKKIDLILIIYSDTPRLVSGDKLRLRQVLLNIIGNAVKFTDKGEVVVRVQIEDESDAQVNILITVEDSGIGISDDDQKELFKAFSQVDAASNRRYSGTGLGLVISKNLVNLMGGDISLESQPGQGSKFSIHLPFPVLVKHDPQPALENPGHHALIYASRSICLQEIQSLFDRAGVSTQANIIDMEKPIAMIMQDIKQNLEFSDLVVIDFRHCPFELHELYDQNIPATLRVIIMHYDLSLIADRQVIERFEFISLITTSSELNKLIFYPELNETQPEPAVPQPLDEKSKQILLVDDNEINLALGCELIQLWGHYVDTARHAEEALQCFRSKEYDLIILDIQMPQIDGIDLMKMMREEKPDAGSPIVALTANIMHGEGKRLIDQGFDFSLDKPIDEDKLKTILQGNLVKPESVYEADNTDAGDNSVDVEGSLSLCADNASLLNQIFEILLREIPGYRNQLNGAQEQSDNSRIALIIHKIQGVTCYVSLPVIREQALEIQRVLSKNPDQDVKSRIQDIIKELHEIEKRVEEFLRDATAIAN